jgi:restriction system protein
MSRYWVIAPVESRPTELFDKVWQFDLDNSLISVGWAELGDVSTMSRDALIKAVAATYPEKPQATKGLIVNMLWAFWHEIRPDDFVIARRGRTVLTAVGKVVSAAFYAPGKDPFLASPKNSHHGFLEVEWQEQPRNKKFPKIVFPMYTLKDLSEVEYRSFVEADSNPIAPPQTSEPDGAVEDYDSFGLEKHLEEFIVSNFKTIFKGELLMYEDGTGADGQQYETNIIGRIDILAFEPKSNSFVVIELKKGSTSDQVVGQTLRYMGWVKDKLCKDGQVVKGLIICLESDPKLDYAIKMINNIDVKYWTVLSSLCLMRRSPLRNCWIARRCWLRCSGGE